MHYALNVVKEVNMEMISGHAVVATKLDTVPKFVNVTIGKYIEFTAVCVQKEKKTR